MRTYRIEEKRYDCGKIEFIPQYKDENCVQYYVGIEGSEWAHFRDWKNEYQLRYPITIKFDTYDEALALINENKKSLLSPKLIETIIHEIN